MKRRKFFFREWSFISKVDPKAFESRRRQALGDAIQELGSCREYGESLQTEIDVARISKGDPESAILDAVKDLNRRLSSLDDELAALAERLKASRSNS